MSDAKKRAKSRTCPSAVLRRALDRANENHTREIFALVDEFYRRVLVPFCNKHQLKFVSIGRRYWFFAGDGRYYQSRLDLPRSARKEADPVFRSLELVGWEDRAVGSMLWSYTPKGWVSGTGKQVRPVNADGGVTPSSKGCVVSREWP